MPGICGIIESSAIAIDTRSVVLAMQRSLTSDPWHVCQSLDELPIEIAMGGVSLDHLPRRQTIARDTVTGSGIVLDGEVFESASLAAELCHTGIESAEDEHARLILAGYLQEGNRFLRRIHGSFSAAIWDGKARRLVLITDRFGTRPLYIRSTEHGLRFASGIAALLADEEARPRVNPRGLAQFFTFGHYLRDDTALTDVRVLPAAACFAFSASTGALQTETYWSLREAAVEIPTDRAELLERIDAAFVTAVRRSTNNARHLGLSLSGGLDARTILGVIDVRQTPLQALCLGVRGSLDHRSSAALAQLANCPYQSHVLDSSFLERFREHLEQMVALTDGQYLSQCIVMPTLGVLRQLGIRTLLRGHAGELMHMRKAYNYSLDEAALQIRSDSGLRDWLFGRLQAYLLDGVSKPLFVPSYQQAMRELAGQSLAEDLADMAHVEQPLERIWSLFVSQRLRRETVLSLLKFRSVVEPRLPYLDNDLVPLLLSSPTDLKLGEEIQTYILRRHRPAFLDVANTNTGARVGASSWSSKIATLQMKVLAKLGVPGYQPYERLGLWLRRELAPVVRDILLDTRTLDRGVFSPAGIQAVVKQHLEQGRNHTFLLMGLMIFELGLRRLLDRHSGYPNRASELQVAAT